MQRKTRKLQEQAARAGLRVSNKKSKVMRINGKSTEPVTVNVQNLDETSKFTYLGGVVTTQGGGGDDITCRIGKARTAFRKLNRIWKSSHYSIMTKVYLYNSLVKSVLLYGCETWKMNEGDARKLDTFQFTCTRRIIKIRWPYVISNEDPMKRAVTKRVSTEIKTRRWKWIGHVQRIDFFPGSMLPDLSKTHAECPTVPNWAGVSIPTLLENPEFRLDFSRDKASIPILKISFHKPTEQRNILLLNCYNICYEMNKTFNLDIQVNSELQS